MLKISFPLILINFKTYQESLGREAMVLATIAEKVGSEYGVCIAVAPQFVDISAIATNVQIPVFSQHVDPEPPGPHTGRITPESLKAVGAVGSILNHSEHRLGTGLLRETLGRCKSLGLVTCVCANTPRVAKVLSALNPDMVAVEPPELIGTGVSVSRAQPGVITDSVERVKSININIKVLCGAGITSGNDVAMALQLGSEGILVASGLVKARNPESVLRDFALKAAKS